MLPELDVYDVFDYSRPITDDALEPLSHWLQMYLGLREPSSHEEEAVYFSTATLLRSAPYDVGVAKVRQYLERCVKDFSDNPLSPHNDLGEEVWRAITGFISVFRAKEQYTIPQVQLIDRANEELENLTNPEQVFFESDEFSRLWRQNCRTFRSDHIGPIFDRIFRSQTIQHNDTYVASEEELFDLVRRLARIAECIGADGLRAASRRADDLMDRHSKEMDQATLEKIENDMLDDWRDRPITPEGLGYRENLDYGEEANSGKRWYERYLDDMDSSDYESMMLEPQEEY